MNIFYFVFCLSLKALSPAFTQRELRFGICLKWTAPNFYSGEICAIINSVNYACFTTVDRYKTRVSLKHTKIFLLLKWKVTEFSPLLQCCNISCYNSCVSIGLYRLMIELHYHITLCFGEWLPSLSLCKNWIWVVEYLH